MLTYPITYTDFNGTERTENFLFNYTKAELLKMQLMDPNKDISSTMKEALDSKDSAAIIEFFENLVLNAIGKKSEDGRSFEKTAAYRESFKNSEAYSVMLMDLLTDADKSIDFVTKVIPKDLAEAAQKSPDFVALKAAQENA